MCEADNQSSAVIGEADNQSSPIIGEDQTCQVCGDSLSKGIVVYCGVCNTAHHQDCWRFVGLCSTFACGSHRCIDFPLDNATTEAGSSFVEIDDKGTCYVNGNKQRLNHRPGSGTSLFHRTPSSAVREMGESTGSSSPASYSRIDVDTALEIFFQFSAAACLGFPIIILLSEMCLLGWESIFYFFPLSLLLITIRMFIDCTYIIDHDRGLLLYGRSFLGRTSTWSICALNEIKKAGLEIIRHVDKNTTYYTYSIIIVLPNDTAIRVTDPDTNMEMVVGFGRILATYFECEFSVPSNGNAGLQVAGWDILMEPIEAQWKRNSVFGHPGFWDIAIFIGAALSTYLWSIR